MRDKWVDLMMRRGTLACAEVTYNRSKSASNFNAMWRARVMYQAAVKAIGKDVVAKSMGMEDVAVSGLANSSSGSVRFLEGGLLGS